MKPTHVLVVTQLGNGHVYPALPICSELRKRGYRVSYPCTSHYEQIIRAAGAEPLLFKTSPKPREAVELVQAGLPQSVDAPQARTAFKMLRAFSFADARALMSQLEPQLRADPPDIILYDRYSPAGRVLASRLGVRPIHLSPHFAYQNGLAVRKCGVSHNPEAIHEWSHDLDTFFSEEGIPTEKSYWHMEKLSIHCIPEFFQFNASSFNSGVCFVGALLNRPYRRAWKRPTDGRPVVMLSGISSRHDLVMNDAPYLRILIDVLGQIDCHAILSTTQVENVGLLPTNFEVNRYASHLEILPHTALLICHAGMGTTLEALYHGVPLLMIPGSYACEEVADRTEELGGGIQIARSNVTPSLVNAVVRHLIDDTKIHARASELKHIFSQNGGERLAVDKLAEALTA